LSAYTAKSPLIYLSKGRLLNLREEVNFMPKRDGTGPRGFKRKIGCGRIGGLNANAGNLKAQAEQFEQQATGLRNQAQQSRDSQK
jgi:hypothetical protein